jgi:UDPglucose--hexose-1-phosphate uridylyltransferase
VIVAPGRERRPGAARGTFEPPTPGELAACPFCEGREGRTPPESLAVRPDGAGADEPGWLVRVVPNKFPAFERQEVVIHSPRHKRSLVELSAEEVELVAGAWSQRAQAAAGEGFPYVHALVNEGREAGASLAHSHSQLIWLREPPPEARAETDGGGCRICAAVEAERRSERVVEERDGLVLFCPYASRSRYELRVAPVEHEAGAFGSARLAPALQLAIDGLRRLRLLEGVRPVNAWLHDAGHWHLEVLPRLSVFAGVELGAGYYVNSLAPEDAAAALRRVELPVDAPAGY